MACPNGGRRCGRCERCQKRKMVSRRRIKNERRLKRKKTRKNNHAVASKKFAAKPAK